ncbi:MAG: OmpA family protein [Ignavibacteria bacterium]|nr:OmpA family protein [Ignavibacteria bacterium]
MKKTFPFLTLSALVLSLSLTSCGPSKKLVESQSKVDKLKSDSTNTHGKLNDCNMLVMKLNKEKSVLEAENSSIQNDVMALNNDNTESKMTIAEQAIRLQNLQNLIQSQKDILSKLKNSIADALLNYSADELMVTVKDGNVYVSLQEKLLFKSGSDVIDPKGKEALGKLAIVLNNTKNITVLIEGHTDNIPIKTNQFKDNWDLSTARATSIVRVFIKDNAFDSERITAAGKSSFHPVQSNETAEGRAANRRTEVILSPDLKELYKILEQ